MNQKLRKIYPKILGSVLVPVFLFAQIPQAAANDSTIIPVTFQIKNADDNQSVFERYHLQPRYLFQNIFKAGITADIFQLMAKDPSISYVEKDGILSAALVKTEDPFFTTDDSNSDRQWYLPKTKIPEAWDYSKGSADVVVAVVDTGIHASHIELNDGRIMEGFDATKNEMIPAASNSDDNGHGTAVAGVIGAIPNNQKGTAGVNWSVKIMPVKTLSADGTGDTSTVALGIVWAADHGANIINLSLGGPGFGSDQTLSNAISYAYNKGVLLVAAAGNDLALHGINLDSKPIYPVCGDNNQNMILGVAATDIDDHKADFSNFGALCIDISAPGKRILTAGFLPSDPADNILIYGSGTSLATPIVSGIAALIKAHNPNLSNGEIRNLITKTADNIDPLNQTNCLGGSCNGFLGKGRINALAAFLPLPVTDGTLMKEPVTKVIYYIKDKIKRAVSDTAFSTRGFDPNQVLTDSSNQLAYLPTGPALPPAEGTLVMDSFSPQVYVIESELKRPLTYLVFITRGYSFSNIKILPPNELGQYPTGEWAAPPDGTMVLIKDNPTVYVMDKKVVRPVTYFVFNQRKLSFAKVISVSPDEFSHIPRPGDFFWLPPNDGTLVKSDFDPVIYLIENGTKRALSFEAFTGRHYNFSNVFTLTKAEIDVIAPGLPLLIP